MCKIVFIAICAISSLIFLTATPLEADMKSSLRMPLQEPRCDAVAGTAECTDYCQQNGFEAGFCHESRMKCQCYQARPPFWMPNMRDIIEAYAHIGEAEVVPQPRFTCNVLYSEVACSLHCMWMGYREGHCNEQEACICDKKFTPEE